MGERLREPFPNRGDSWRLHYPRRNHEVRRRHSIDSAGDVLAGDLKEIAGCDDPGHSDTLPHRQFKPAGITFDVVIKLVTVIETIGFVTFVPVAGQNIRPVGRVDGERIPTLTTPRLTNAATFEDDELASSCLQVIADTQTGLSATNDDNVEMVQER